MNSEQMIARKRELFDVNMTKEGLLELRKQFWPKGSGPLWQMASICALIDIVLETKGWTEKKEWAVHHSYCCPSAGDNSEPFITFNKKEDAHAFMEKCIVEDSKHSGEKFSMEEYNRKDHILPHNMTYEEYKAWWIR